MYIVTTKKESKIDSKQASKLSKRTAGDSYGSRVPVRLTDEAARVVMRAAGLEPLEPYHGADAPWRCQCTTCKREVSPSYTKVRAGRGCAYCAGRRVDPDEAIATMRTAGLEPLEPYPGADAPWRCQCTTCKRDVSPSYSSVQSRQSGCAYCAGARVNPDEAVEVMRAAGLEPLEPYHGANESWRCQCTTCKREVTPNYSTVRNGSGCIYCAGRRVDPDEAIATMRAAGLEPLEPYANARAPWRCRCMTCEREVAPTYGAVRSKQGGCAYCGGTRVDPDEAVEVMRAAGLETLEPYPGALARWRCRCTTCEREVAPMYDSVRNGSGCIYCAGKRVDPDEAVEVMRAAGLEPLEPYPGANVAWRCRCTTCEREVTPWYSSVRGRDAGCIYCAGRRVDPDEAVELMRAAGLEPLEPYPGAHVPWRCRCTTCAREVSPNYDSVQGGGACRFCSTGGIDYTAPGIIYLMHHPELFCLKIGVSTTAARTVRVDTHAKTGWVIIQTWDTPSGEDAEQIEQQVLTWWRNELGAPIALTKAEMPNGGWSETAALIHVDVDWTVNRVNWLVAQLDGE